MCFDAFYLSQEINLRKPDASCYNYILKEQDILAEETLFIDDTKENTDAAKALRFKVWNINPKTEDVVDLFTTNAHLF
jgi:putative hydrolase of the HAD superfamily